jgi:hypothetical protein
MHTTYIPSGALRFFNKLSITYKIKIKIKIK